MSSCVSSGGSSCGVGSGFWPAAPLALVLAVSSLAAMVGAESQEGSEVHEVIRVSPPDLSRPAELSVAINPVNPDNMVIVSLAEGPPGGPGITNYAHASSDGGRSWETVSQPNPEGRTQGDDVVTFDGAGRAYRTYISFDGIGVPRPQVARTGIFVSRSDDGGYTWQDPVPVVDHVNFSRSVDGGESFSVPIRISDSGGNAVDSDDTVEGAVPAVGPAGEVYVAWAGPRGIVMDTSLDGGWTFGQDRVIAHNPGGWDIPLAGMARHNGLPVTGVDVSRGEHRGSIYVNWIDQRNGDTDVFLVASRDGGDTWTEPLRVNDDPVGNGKDQLFTWMSVDPVDGSVNVVFLDRRGTEAGAQGVTLARSTDGGRSFSNLPIAQEPFVCPETLFYGDYLAVAAADGRVVAAWPHCLDDGGLALSAALFRF